MNPPLRTPEDVAAIKEAIKDGTIDCIVTDHAPHHQDEKEVEFSHANNGIVGLESSFALSYTYLVKTGIISIEKLMDLLGHPERSFDVIFNTVVDTVAPVFGDLDIGSSANRGGSSGRLGADRHCTEVLDTVMMVLGNRRFDDGELAVGAVVNTAALGVDIIPSITGDINRRRRVPVEKGLTAVMVVDTVIEKSINFAVRIVADRRVVNREIRAGALVFDTVTLVTGDQHITGHAVVIDTDDHRTIVFDAVVVVLGNGRFADGDITGRVVKHTAALHVRITPAIFADNDRICRIAVEEHGSIVIVVDTKVEMSPGLERSVFVDRRVVDRNIALVFVFDTVAGVVGDHHITGHTGALGSDRHGTFFVVNTVRTVTGNRRFGNIKNARKSSTLVNVPDTAPLVAGDLERIRRVAIQIRSSTGIDTVVLAAADRPVVHREIAAVINATERVIGDQDFIRPMIALDADGCRTVVINTIVIITGAGSFAVVIDRRTVDGKNSCRTRGIDVPDTGDTVVVHNDRSGSFAVDRHDTALVVDTNFAVVADHRAGDGKVPLLVRIDVLVQNTGLASGDLNGPKGCAFERRIAAVVLDADTVGRVRGDVHAGDLKVTGCARIVNTERLARDLDIRARARDAAFNLRNAVLIVDTNVRIAGDGRAGNIKGCGVQNTRLAARDLDC